MPQHLEYAVTAGVDPPKEIEEWCIKELAMRRADVDTNGEEPNA